MCHHGFSYARGQFMRCHGFGASSIAQRDLQFCNTYFANVYMKTINKYVQPAAAVDVWSKHLKSFGLGQFMGYDLPTGKRGKVPDSKTYKKMYPGWRWGSKTIVSNAIGQGEVLMTPIQLANMMATVANRGYYYTPHIIKKIKGEIIDPKFRTKHVTTINRKYFDPVIAGLYLMFLLSLAELANGLRVEGIDICGKTGTAENYTKINGKRVKLQDHSIFVAFAPKDNPKIAIAVLVENGHFGARNAGPIASLMIEKYLRGKITRTDLEKRMLDASLQSEYNKYTQKSIDSVWRAKNGLKPKSKDTIDGESLENIKIINEKPKLTSNLDWISVIIYIILVVLGWLNIYSSSLSTTVEDASLFDFTEIYGKQMMFIFFTIPLIFMVLSVEGKFYEKYSSIIFVIALLLLAGLFLFGKTIAGQRCWYAIGSFTLQPSEFAKAATALALAKYLSDIQINLKDVNRQIQALLIIMLPVLLILPQPDPGSALIYSVFILVLYREGLPVWYIWTGFIAILLFVLTLIFEPYYVILIIFLIMHSYI